LIFLLLFLFFFFFTLLGSLWDVANEAVAFGEFTTFTQINQHEYKGQKKLMQSDPREET